jgi:FixJ family two-component response regulator
MFAMRSGAVDVLGKPEKFSTSTAVGASASKTNGLNQARAVQGVYPAGPSR